MFISRHTLKWTKTCRSSGDFPHAHTAHFLLNRHNGRKAKDYSTGMKERLELCLALVPHPRFLFLDEPQNGLDPDGIASLSETLRAYRDKGNCVVISTHLLHEIQGVPDECIMIRHGRAVQVTDLTGVNLADLYQGR